MYGIYFMYSNNMRQIMKDYAKHEWLKEIEVEGHVDKFTNAFLVTMATIGIVVIMGALFGSVIAVSLGILAVVTIVVALVK